MTQLLSRDPQPKKRKPAPQKKQPEQRPQGQQSDNRTRQQKGKAAAKEKGGIVKKLVMSFFALLLIGFIIAPKPQLLVYKKLNLVANSIYIPDWFGQPGYFLDSKQRVVVDKQLGLVYLCYSEDQPREKCNRYQFIEQKGMFAALGHYHENNK